MSAIRIKIEVELETEDCSEETVKTAEITVARLSEQIEHQLCQGIKENCPEVKVKCRGIEI